MESIKLEIEVPKSILNYIDYTCKENLDRLRVLMIYPLLKDEILTYGKAAEMLGIERLTLILYLGELGIPYFDASLEDVIEDANNATR